MEVICEYCGKKLFRKPSRVKRTKHHFCNKECRHLFSTVESTCEYCGKKFRRDVNQLKISRGYYHFCNKECRHLFSTVELTCEHCGQKFKRNAKTTAHKSRMRHFCSIECHWRYVVKSGDYSGKNHPNWKGGKTELTCEYCGKKIFKYMSCIKLHKHTFCSKECKYKFHSESEEYRGENSPKWKQIELACEYCGKKLFRKPSQVKKTKHHFCSKECYYKFHSESEEYRGESSPCFNSIEQTCQQCGKKFFEVPNRIKNGKGKYCSKKCFIESYNTLEILCRYCGKSIKQTQSKLKKGRGVFCGVDCMAKAYSELDQYRGENKSNWKGGFFPYYGQSWLQSRRLARKKAKHVSEISGCNGGLEVHHIIPMRKIVEKYFDSCLNPYMNMVKYHHLRILPYNLIPELIFNEANQLDNLIVLTSKEHHEYEGMPFGFFKLFQNK